MRNEISHFLLTNPRMTLPDLHNSVQEKRMKGHLIVRKSELKFFYLSFNAFFHQNANFFRPPLTLNSKQESNTETISCTTLPEPIQEVYLIDKTANSIRVNWTHKIQELVEGNTFLKYNVKVEKNLKVSNEVPLKILCKHNEINITGLEEGRKYRISVQIITTYGASRYSQPLVEATIEISSKNRKSIEDQIVIFSFIKHNHRQAISFSLR